MFGRKKEEEPESRFKTDKHGIESFTTTKEVKIYYFSAIKQIIEKFTPQEVLVTEDQFDVLRQRFPSACIKAFKTGQLYIDHEGTIIKEKSWRERIEGILKIKH